MSKQQVSRRQFLRGLLVGTGAASLPAILASCGTTPAAPAPTAAVAPTAAPAATAAQIAATAVTAPATAAPVVAAQVEVTHWDWFVSQSPALEEAIKVFQAENPNITIKRTVNNVDNDNYSNLFQLAVKGESVPDVFMVPQKPTKLEMFASGEIADLSAFADFKEFQASFPNPQLNFLEGTNTIAGKTYSAPFGAQDDSMWIQFWVNTKVFKDAGIVDSSGNAKLPVTGEDVLAAARAINEKSGGQVYGYAFAAKSNIYHWPTYMAQLSGAPGGEVGLDHRTGKYTMGTNPAYRAVIDLINTLRDDGHILPDSGSIDDEALRVLFAQNKFGMYLNGNWIVNSIKKAAPDFNDYAVTHVPLFGTAEPTSYFYKQLSPEALTTFGISAKSKNAEAAWEWFRFLHSPAVGELWVKGGNGRSVFTSANKPEYFPNEALRNLATLGPQLTRVGPSPALRNPDFGKIKIGDVKPGIQDIMQGIYTGQLTDIDAALQELDAMRTTARDQAIADAVAAGAKVSLDDYIFADWDLTKDYVTKAG